MATVHIIGGGVSGLAAATTLAERHVPVTLYEATAHAGGRARSSTDAALGSIDHGLHFIHGAAVETLRYLERIGARERLVEAAHPLPPTRAPLVDYLALAEAVMARDATLDVHADNTLMAEWMPRVARLLLHTPLEEVISRAVRRAVLQSRRRCYAPVHSLSETFITPALEHLEYHGGSVYFGHALTRLEQNGDGVTSLTFARKKVAMGADDVLILATPPAFTQSLLPGITVPMATHASITLHYAVAHREVVGSIVAPIDAPVDVVKYGEGRISACIRVADAQWNSDGELLAQRIWRWVQRQHPYLQGIAQPPHAMWREKRAGHRLVPGAEVMLDGVPPRVLIAGDWVVPHAPASLEVAIASGHRAADAAQALLPKFAPRQVQHPANHYGIR